MIEEYVQEVLLDNLSLASSVSSDISVVDIAEKFQLSLSQSKSALYEYYVANREKYADTLAFHIMCVYTDVAPNDNDNVQRTHFKLVQDARDEAKILDSVPRENILDLFVYSLSLKDQGAGAESAQKRLALRSLKPVGKVFVSHGMEINVKQEQSAKTGGVPEKSAPRSSESIRRAFSARAATEPAPSTTTTSTTTTSGSSGSSGNSTSSKRPATVQTTKKTGSSFMGLRSMEFLQKRKEQDALKEEQRLKELKEKRGISVASVSKPTSVLPSSSSSSSVTPPVTDPARAKKLKELESMFSDDDEDEEEEDVAVVEKEEVKKENTPVEKQEVKKTSDLAQVEDLFDTTNDESMIEVKHSSPVKPSSYVDEDGFIVTTSSTPSTTSNTSKKPAKRTASTLPLVSASSSSSSSAAKKPKKQGNLMSFFSKK